MAILGVGVYLVFIRLLGSIVASLVAVNGILFVFSGFYLPVTIRFVDRFTTLNRLDELLRMQQLGFLMHYDYLIVPAYLSAVLVVKHLQDCRMSVMACYGYAFLLGTIYEGLVPVVALTYLMMSIRNRNVSFRYLFVLVAGQVTATIVAYAAQIGNGDANWIGRSVTTYGADNSEYILQLIVLFGLIIFVSFGVGYLSSLVLRLPSNVATYRGSIVNMFFALLVLHVFGLSVAGYTNEAVRGTLGLQAVSFAAGMTHVIRKQR